MTPALFDLIAGDGPLLVSMPHSGTAIPEDLARDMTPGALALPDTDWHLGRLYDFAPGLGATMIKANYSRYVIDLNRRPDGTELYAGADNTELCPLTTFDFAPIYQAGRAPGASEIARRITEFHRPYHAAIERELDRIKQDFGYALLYDAHSIGSRVPRFFDGELASFNIGTGGGTSASQRLAERLTAICQGADGYRTVCDGRFKGGFITRRYGAPDDHIHAVQMELSQKTYMNEKPPYDYDDARAAKVRPILRAVLDAMLSYG